MSFTVCPHIMKSGARYPLTTIITGRRGENLSRLVQFFLPSLTGVYGWVTSTIFGGGQQRDGIYRESILGGTKLILFSQLDQLLITPKRGPEYLFEKKLLPQFGQIWSH